MKIRKKDLPKRLQEGLRVLDKNLLFGSTMPRPNPASEQENALYDYMTEQRRSWGKWASWGAIVALVSFILTFAAVFGDSQTGAAFGVGMSMAVAMIINAYAQSRRDISIRVLRALMPILGLSELEQNHTEAYISVKQNIAIVPDHRKEILSQLDQLLSEADRLEIHKEEVAKRYGGIEHRTEMANEVVRLRARLAATEDQVARETYEGSLQIAEERLKRFVATAPLVDRIEAQIELIKQTMGSFTEALGGLQEAPSADLPDIGQLRERVSQVLTQSKILETSYEEVRALTS